MKTSLRVLAFGAAIAAGLLSCTSRTEQTAEALHLLLDSLKSEYAPDNRVSLWEVEVAVRDEISLEGMIGHAGAYKRIEEALESEFPGVENKLELLRGPETLPVNALVNNSVIHLRRGPSSKTEMVTQALLGTPARILKEGDGKRLVQIADGYIGYVNIHEVQELDAEALASYAAARKVIYMEQYGFAFSEADPGSLPVSDLVIGNMLRVLGESGAFWQVGYPDGREAFVRKDEVLSAAEVFSRQPVGENLVATALKFTGIPYLWGGTSAKNIDCSGLMSNIYYLHGIQLPRDADMQSRCGRELTTQWDASVLEAGDMLFFGRKATNDRPERVTHVGMYMGEGEFIHSAGFRDRVSINHMDSTQAHFIADYPDIFVRATRILGEEGGDFGRVSENDFYKAILKN